MDIKELVEKALDPVKTWVKGLVNDVEDRLHHWVDIQIQKLRIELKRELAQMLTDSAEADQNRLDEQQKIS